MGPAIKTSRHERGYNARDNCFFFLKDEALRAVAFLVGGGVRARVYYATINGHVFEGSNCKIFHVCDNKHSIYIRTVSS